MLEQIFIVFKHSVRQKTLRKGQEKKLISQNRYEVFTVFAKFNPTYPR
jgi:hypothetical protein